MTTAPSSKHPVANVEKTDPTSETRVSAHKLALLDEQAPTALPLLEVATPPAHDVVPTPPRTTDGLALGRHRHHPTTGQVAGADDVARELGSPQYREDFTKRAPDPARLAAGLRVAAHWTAHRRAAEAWAEYARTQEALAWEGPLLAAHALDREFALALAHDPTVATRYAHVKTFLEARQVAARRARKTQAANKKAAAAAAAAAASAPKPPLTE